MAITTLSSGMATNTVSATDQPPISGIADSGGSLTTLATDAKPPLESPRSSLSSTLNSVEDGAQDKAGFSDAGSNSGVVGGITGGVALILTLMLTVTCVALVLFRCQQQKKLRAVASGGREFDSATYGEG